VVLNSLQSPRMLVISMRWLTALLGLTMLLLAVTLGWMVHPPAWAEPKREAPQVAITPAADVPAVIPSTEVIVAAPVLSAPVPIAASSIPAAAAAPVAVPIPTPLPPAPILATTTPTLPTVIAGAVGINVRTGPGTDHARVGYLAPGAQARAIGRYGDWWQIEHNDALGWVANWVVTAFNVDDVPQIEPLVVEPTSLPPTPLPPPTAPEEIDEARWIDIDLTHQTLTAYEGRTPVRTTLVSTGLPSTPTPTGQYRIWVKFRYDDMEGPGYYLADVPYVMYFYGGYGLHGVFWHANFGHPMSHGCVNLPTTEAEWLFNWADVGTLVNIRD
jgi:lipoprotein-anchoring transpeptidase ErfK/SrfK